MLGLGDELDVFTARYAVLVEDLLELVEVLAVKRENLVLVELDLHRDPRVQHRHPRASVVDEHLLEVVQHALENWQLDALAVIILVSVATRVMTGLQDHIDLLTQRIKQVNEEIQDLLTRNRGHQHGNRNARPAITVSVVTEAGPRHDL